MGVSPQGTQDIDVFVVGSKITMFAGSVIQAVFRLFRDLIFSKALPLMADHCCINWFNSREKERWVGEEMWRGGHGGRGGRRDCPCVAMQLTF